MKRKIGFLFFCIIMFSFSWESCYAQADEPIDSKKDVILFMDGKSVEYDSIVLDTSYGYIYYSFINDKNRKKIKQSDVYDVFSIKHDGLETIIYETFDDDEFSANDMRIVISGKYDARIYHKSLPVFIEGAAFGIFSTLLPYSSFISLSIPLLYSTSKGFITPPESLIRKQNPNYTDNELYLYGYKQTAKNKDLRNAIGGSLLGAGIGTAIIFIVRSISD